MHIILHVQTTSSSKSTFIYINPFADKTQPHLAFTFFYLFLSLQMKYKYMVVSHQEHWLWP